MRRLKDYDQDYWANQTVFGLGVKMVLGITAAILVIGAVGFGIAWLNAGKDVVSPHNVKSQYQFAYDYEEALKGIAQNVCTFQTAYDAAKGTPDASQRLDQLLAQRTLYQAREREYDARLRDAFRAKYVKPSDVPDRAPTLTEEIAAVCGAGP